MMIKMNQRNKEYVPKLVIPANIGLEIDEEFKHLSEFIDEWGWNFESIIDEIFDGDKRDEFVITKEVLDKHFKRGD